MMDFKTIGRTLLVVASLLMSNVSSSRPELEDFVANTCVITQDDLIKRNTSYHGCIQHCKDMSDCAAVSHKQKASLCRLNFGEPTPGICHGYVYSQKANLKMDSSSQCSCPVGHRCELNGGCVPSICDKLDAPEHGRMLGNQLSVGDKVAFLCNHGYLLQGNKQRVCTVNVTWSGRAVTCSEDPACNNYLVSGPGGVEDDQLTESSYWCLNDIDFCTNEYDPRGMSAKYARINSTGLITGGWSAQSNTPNEYIQVDFIAPRTISSIMLQGRDPGPWDKDEYVTATAFKVLHSFNCLDFAVIIRGDATEMIFEGNSNREEIVTRYLPERTGARCVRLNPVTWHNFIALRLDILGC